MAITHGGDIFGIARANNWDWRTVLDFSASINPLGPAPGVNEAIVQALDRIPHYPEREPERLLQALADKWNVEPSQIILGNGATELIFFAARMLQGNTTLALPVFSEFHRAFPQADNAELESPDTWPPHQMLVLTRPANPTGWSFDLNVLQTRAAPTLIDESFLEFSGLPSATTLLADFPQLLILRSLTKFYALPGLRLGALVGSADVMAKWRKLREPWQVNVLAEEAALAALQDTCHSKRSLAFVRKERQWLFEQIRAIPGANPHPSDVNFLHVQLAYPGAQLYRHLLRSRILIRDCAQWPGLSGEAVRIAVRTRSENEKLLQAWREFQCD